MGQISRDHCSWGPLVRWQPRAGKAREDLTLCTTLPSSRIKRNASADELVRRAMDAATAYENILGAIQAAEDAANKATSASQSALQVGTSTSSFFRFTPEAALSLSLFLKEWQKVHLF